MSKTVLVGIALLGWFLCIYQAVEQHRRLPDVQMWADAAYTAGYTDGKADRTVGVLLHNQKFSTDAVVAAYEGDFVNVIGRKP